MLVDSVTSALSLEWYYPCFFSLEGVSCETWEETYLNGGPASAVLPSATVFHRDAESSCVIYIQSIPMGDAPYYQGKVLCYLDEEELLSPFQSIRYDQGGMLCILDAAGELVMQDNPGGLDFSELDQSRCTGSQGSFLQSIGGETMLVSYLHSGEYGWTYLSVIPQSVILAPSSGARLFLFVMIIVSLAAGCLLAFYFAAKTAKPVISITNLLMRNNQLVSPSELPGGIERLLEKNKTLQQAVNQQMDDQRTALFYTLLSGGFHDEEEIRRSFADVQLPLDAPLYCVMLVTLLEWQIKKPPQAQACAYKKLLKEVLAARIPGVVGIGDLDLSTSVLLAAVDESRRVVFREELERSAHDIISQFSQAVQSDIQFSAYPVERLMEIPSAFSFLENWDPVPQEGNIVCWPAEDDPEGRHVFYYPLSLELRLIAAIQDSRPAMAEALLDLIAHYNKRVLASNGEYAMSFLQALYGTLMRLVNECSSHKQELLERSGSLFDAAAQSPPWELFQRLRECFLITADAYGAHEEARGDGQVRRILDYVNEHFTDPQLSLTSVAAAFHITEPYLSRIFKQGAGENFSKYVERLRAERARMLIREHKLPLSEIAQQVGYNSPQVFRRAYKRVFSVSPSEDSAPDDPN